MWTPSVDASGRPTFVRPDMMSQGGMVGAPAMPPMAAMGCMPCMPCMAMPGMAMAGLPGMECMPSMGMSAAVPQPQALPQDDEAAKASEERPKQRGGDKADRDVRRLGSHFGIDTQTVERLDEIIEKRGDTKERDLAKLYEVLDTARNPASLLMAKMDEMEDGEFVANFKRDELIERFTKEHSLHDSARCRLVELRVRRKSHQDEDLGRLEKHLRCCEDPSFTVISLVKKVVQGRISDVPDMDRAFAIAGKFQLDEAAVRKLRDIVEKRAEDLGPVLDQLETVLAVAFSPAATFTKVAPTLLSGELLAPEEIEVVKLESRQQARREELKRKQAQKLQKQKKKKQKGDHAHRQARSREPGL